MELEIQDRDRLGRMYQVRGEPIQAVLNGFEFGRKSRRIQTLGFLFQVRERGSHWLF